ncbi:ester cyclase [Paenibacillus sp. GCM10023248]|uniref:ester cyclase n=1 Tax=Bacillales TaxID=1385 RepID=UPI002377DAA1|nr:MULTISPECIES: ester cyclase [Bacillales]MDD9265782.1 ester cyclase [Paenibacillus sp. MAHUQ-63]MDR6879023.1 putative ester cyclase [Bacillus sp. 3255]
MREQHNVERVREFIDAFWNKNQLDCVDQFLSDAYRELSYQSKEGLKKFAATILEAFPDKQYTVEEIVGQGDRVLVRMTVRGTHQGMFFGTEPTGNRIDVTLYRQYRLEESKIIEHRGWIDMVTMWHQIRGH